jgi:hypothetical protein
VLNEAVSENMFYGWCDQRRIETRRRQRVRRGGGGHEDRREPQTRKQGIKSRQGSGAIGQSEEDKEVGLGQSLDVGGMK